MELNIQIKEFDAADVIKVYVNILDSFSKENTECDTLRDDMDNPFDIDEFLYKCSLTLKHELYEYVKENIDKFIGKKVLGYIHSQFYCYNITDDYNISTILSMIDKESLKECREMILKYIDFTYYKNQYNNFINRTINND